MCCICDVSIVTGLVLRPLFSTKSKRKLPFFLQKLSLCIEQGGNVLRRTKPALTRKIVENEGVKRKKHSLSERSEFRMLRATTRSFQIFGTGNSNSPAHFLS
jgi:hypothetical protein